MYCLQRGVEVSLKQVSKWYVRKWCQYLSLWCTPTCSCEGCNIFKIINDDIWHFFSFVHTISLDTSKNNLLLLTSFIKEQETADFFIKSNLINQGEDFDFSALRPLFPFAFLLIVIQQLSSSVCHKKCLKKAVEWINWM